MHKQDLVHGMLVRLTAGKGKYGPDGKWAAFIRVISVTTVGHELKVTGLQYRNIATRGGDHNPTDHFRFKEGPIQMTPRGFYLWWDTFNAKILV